MRFASWFVALGLLVATTVAAGCQAAPDEEEEDDDQGALVIGAGTDEPIKVPAAGTTLTELSQSTLMSTLGRAGFHFGAHFGVADDAANDLLAQRAALYKFIADDVAADLDAKRARDPKLSTQVANGVTRILDKGWLRANYARFELSGVVNRLDRMASSQGTTCGEVRFLYRLAYTHPTRDPAQVSYSRLPVAINVVYDVPRTAGAGIDECVRVANAWHVPATARDESSFVGYLTKQLFPLASLRLRQVELNAQVLRVPSESKTDMGGVAEYAFRVYALDGGAPVLRPLENTPDVARLEADPALRTELAAYLVAHVAEIDLGTLRVPDKFLTTKASAFSTFGSARLANKPYARLFYDAASKTAPALASADLSQAAYVASPAGLLARLDDLTCIGCHQGGRSIAGFHFLGEDSLAKSHPLNVARVGRSPHLLTELSRRRAFIDGLAAGREPSPFRPVAFAPAFGAAAPRSAPCLMPASVGAFRQPFACDAGLTCTSIATNARTPLELGMCLPAITGAGAHATYTHEFAGLPCTRGDITDDPADPTRDAMKSSTFACPAAQGGGGYTCRPASIGVPGGLCTDQCASGNVPRDRANELCAYAGGKEFDDCANRNDFSTCLAGAIKSGLREACDEATPCREDYICQRFVKARSTPPELPADGRGYCVPTYFLFQVRADGHPNPTPSR